MRTAGVAPQESSPSGRIMSQLPHLTSNLLQQPEQHVRAFCVLGLLGWEGWRFQRSTAVKVGRWDLGYCMCQTKSSTPKVVHVVAAASDLKSVNVLNPAPATVRSVLGVIVSSKVVVRADDESLIWHIRCHRDGLIYFAILRWMQLCKF